MISQQNILKPVEKQSNENIKKDITFSIYFNIEPNKLF